MSLDRAIDLAIKILAVFQEAKNEEACIRIDTMIIHFQKIRNRINIIEEPNLYFAASNVVKYLRQYRLDCSQLLDDLEVVIENLK